jgi:hypothetical protein
LRSCTSLEAFTVQVRLKKDEPELGPDGLLTRILTALSAEGGRGWIFPIAKVARRGLLTFVFDQHHREEVVRRFNAIGIKVPAKARGEKS